jgi:enterobacterial common antigen flippase
MNIRPGQTTPAIDGEASDQRSGRSQVQILKSTAIIGGASVVNVAFAIIRNKTIAVLLGPHGVGLMGLYGSVADLAQTLAGLGIQDSGVRQIAEAAGTGDPDRIARTATVLRRVSIALGMLGALFLALFSLPIASFTFGDDAYAAAIVLLSAAIFFRLVSAGQLALVQGMRQIADLARINMLGALFSTLISIPMVYVLGSEGIVPALVAMAAVSVLTSWWYSRQIRIGKVSMPARELSQETAALLKLGIAFMATAMLTVGAGYAIRIIVLRADGVAAAGLYQASWALGGLYVGFILQAMGADFYPRLTAVAHDDAQCSRLVNEQTQVSMLLAAPGILATLLAAPLVIRLFYTPDFYPAIDLLRWICLGMMLRVASWPMGFILIAKGARQLFLFVEAAATAVHVGLAWLLVGQLGAIGAGVAFFGLYVWHTALIYVIVRRFYSFRLSTENVRLAAIFLPPCGILFAAFYVLPSLQANLLGAAIVALSSVYSLRQLLTLLPSETMPKAIRRWLPAETAGNS